MSIESRVEALEHELKILKNEIQSTLLEIREQVLNHYYPELRAEEPPRAKPLTAKPSNTRPNKNNHTRNSGTSRAQRTANPPDASEIKGQVQPFADIFLQNLGEETDFEDEFLNDTYFEDNSGHDAGNGTPDTRYLDSGFDDEVEHDAGDMAGGIMDDKAALSATSSAVRDPQSNALPKTREVVFHQLKQAPSDPQARRRVDQEKVEPQGQTANRRTFAALATWVGDTVAKVGKARTIQVVETYAASGGALSQETQNSLIQLASLASDEEPTTPMGNQEILGLMVTLDQIVTEG